MHRTSLFMIAPILLLLPTTFTSADETTATNVSLEEYFAQLNATMQEVVTLLQRQIEGDETNLLIKRIELSDRSLSAMKDRLRKLREEASNLKEKEISLSGALEAAELELTDTLENDGPQQVMLDQLAERVQSINRRRQDLERELVVLENEVRVEEDDIEVLEAVLDERLGLR